MFVVTYFIPHLRVLGYYMKGLERKEGVDGDIRDKQVHIQRLHKEHTYMHGTRYIGRPSRYPLPSPDTSTQETLRKCVFSSVVIY